MMGLSPAATRPTVQLQGNVGLPRGQKLMAAAGLLGALAASSCCILPLVLFSLGVSGAWISNFTQLAPYQPYFIAATVACLGYGYWLVYRPSKAGCIEGEACARPMLNPLRPLRVLLAAVLVLPAVRLSLLPPFFPHPLMEHPPPT